MKKLLFVFTMLLFSFSLLSGCKRDHAEAAPQQVEAPISHYNSALATEQTRTVSALDMIHTRKIQHGTEVFTEKVLQQVAFCGEDDICVQQEIYYTDQPMTVQLHYSANTGFLQLGGTTFSQELSREDFVQKYASIPLPHPDQYASVVGTVTENGDVFSFRDPISSDAWTLPSGYVLTDSEAVAVVGADGMIQLVSYQFSYATTDALVTEWYALSHVDTNPAIPFDAQDSFVSVNDLQYPLLLEKASGFLQQKENSIHANSSKEITSQVTNVSYRKNTHYNFCHNSSGLTASIDTTIDLTDHSRGGEVSSLSQTERFENGICTIRTYDGAIQTQEGVTKDSFITYFYNQLLEIILLPQYVSSISATEDEGHLRLEFQVTDALGPVISADACKTLYQDQALLDSLTAASITENVCAYLEVDSFLGIPQSAGLSFVGSHVLNNTDYTFQVNSQTEFSFG